MLNGTHRWLLLWSLLVNTLTGLSAPGPVPGVQHDVWIQTKNGRRPRQQSTRGSERLARMRQSIIPSSLSHFLSEMSPSPFKSSSWTGVGLMLLRPASSQWPELPLAWGLCDINHSSVLDTQSPGPRANRPTMSNSLPHLCSPCGR